MARVDVFHPGIGEQISGGVTTSVDTLAEESEVYLLGHIGEHSDLQGVNTEFVGDAFGSTELGEIYHNYGLAGLYVALDAHMTNPKQEPEELYAKVEGHVTALLDWEERHKRAIKERMRHPGKVEQVYPPAEHFVKPLGEIGLKRVAIDERVEELASAFPPITFKVILPETKHTALFGGEVGGTGLLLGPIGQQNLPDGKVRVTSLVLANAPHRKYPSLIAVYSDVDHDFRQEGVIPTFTFCPILDRSDLRSERTDLAVTAAFRPRKGRSFAGRRLAAARAA